MRQTLKTNSRASVRRFRSGNAVLDMALIMPPSHRLAGSKAPLDFALLLEEPMIMNELSIGYGQIVAGMFNDLGMRPRIRAYLRH